MITRRHSTELDLPVKIDHDTGTVTVKDLCVKKVIRGRFGEIQKVHSDKYVEYSNDEIQILKENNGKIDKTIHGLKKIFGGEVINWTGVVPEKVPEVTEIREPEQGDLF